MRTGPCSDSFCGRRYMLWEIRRYYPSEPRTLTYHNNNRRLGGLFVHWENHDNTTRSISDYIVIFPLSWPLPLTFCENFVIGSRSFLQLRIAWFSIPLSICGFCSVLGRFRREGLQISDGKEADLEPCTNMDSACLGDFQEALSLWVLVKSMTVTVYEVFTYVVGTLESVSCFTNAVPSHHVHQPGTRANLLDNISHDI